MTLDCGHKPGKAWSSELQAGLSSRMLTNFLFFQIELDAILSLNHDLAPQNDNSNGVPNKLSKVRSPALKLEALIFLFKVAAIWERLP